VLSDHPTLDNAFLAKIHTVAEKLRNEGALVRFISYSRKNDHFVPSLEALGENVSAWNPEVMSIESFRRFLAEHDAILTSRFHGGVFSVINQSPFAIIGVNDKLRSLAERYPDVDVPLLSTTDPADKFTDTLRALLRGKLERRSALTNAFDNERRLGALGEAAFSEFLASLVFGPATN
jgi:exopolysaccharide biosynthesis predicted pyruvyltransferase EpsI